MSKPDDPGDGLRNAEEPSSRSMPISFLHAVGRSTLRQGIAVPVLAKVGWIGTISSFCSPCVTKMPGLVSSSAPPVRSLRGCDEIHLGRAKLPLSEQSSHPTQGLRLGRSLALPINHSLSVAVRPRPAASGRKNGGECKTALLLRHDELRKSDERTALPQLYADRRHRDWRHRHSVCSVTLHPFRRSRTP